MSLAFLATVVVLAGGAQAAGLDSIANRAREAFLSRDFSRLLNARETVRLALPRHPVMPVVRGAAAGAILESHASRTEDQDVSVVRSALVEGRHGYVELSRRFRVIGTQEPQRDRVLLSAVLRSGTWQITEILIVEASAVN